MMIIISPQMELKERIMDRECARYICLFVYLFTCILTAVRAEARHLLCHMLGTTKSPVKYTLHNVLAILFATHHGIRPMSLTCPDGYELEEWSAEVKQKRASKWKLAQLRLRESGIEDEGNAEDNDDDISTDDSGSESDMSDEDDLMEGEFLVDKIVDCRGTGKKCAFRVRWAGYGSKDDTWETADTLNKCQDKVQAFLQSRGLSDLESAKKRAGPRRKRPENTWPTLRWKHIRLWVSNPDEYGFNLVGCVRYNNLKGFMKDERRFLILPFETVHNPENFNVCLALWLYAYGVRYGMFSNIENSRDVNKLMPGEEIVMKPAFREVPVLMNAAGTEPLRSSVLLHNISRLMKESGFDENSSFYSYVSLVQTTETEILILLEEGLCPKNGTNLRLSNG